MPCPKDQCLGDGPSRKPARGSGAWRESEGDERRDNRHEDDMMCNPGGKKGRGQRAEGRDVEQEKQRESRP